MTKRILSDAFWLVVFAALICAMYLSELGLTTAELVVLAVFAVLALILHDRDAAKDPKYMRGILALDKQGSKRVPELDWLRVIAVVFVIVTHGIQADFSKGYYTAGTGLEYAMHVLFIATLSCNLIYVMISGALILSSEKEESIPAFYGKKFGRIFIPLAVYYLWYLWRNDRIYKTLGVKEIFIRLFTANTPEAPHYWLMYVIFSFYVLAPFLKVMVRGLSYKKLSALTIVALIMMTLINGLPIRSELEVFLAGYTGVALIGYWMSREETRKYDKYIAILGAAALVVMALIVRFAEDPIPYTTGPTPVMCLFTMGLVSLVYMIKPVFSKDIYPIRLISKYSYSLILLHWWALHWKAFGKFWLFTGSHFGLVTGLIVLITLVYSFAVSFVMDNMVCKVLTTLWNLLFKKKGVTDGI